MGTVTVDGSSRNVPPPTHGRAEHALGRAGLRSNTAPIWASARSNPERSPLGRRGQAQRVSLPAVGPRHLQVGPCHAEGRHQTGVLEAGVAPSPVAIQGHCPAGRLFARGVGSLGALASQSRGSGGY
ncbi:hypothetical protein HJG60_011618 [Phyllostomus discolor]|uniref:Uncharacterized protein n=1 Tax=Phyllostomus discolor TaxID=89673 RepID=A0A833ZU52_9CHIR|nr:hypothetical protein HJG60_011618 [Phyllostomus discolor]